LFRNAAIVSGVKKGHGQLNNQSKTFCMHPFTGLATREDGAICACCRSHPVGFIGKDNLEDIWNNDTMRRIRRQVLHGERPPECEPCFSLEDQGVESLRERHIAGIIPEARINLYPDAISKLNTTDYTMPFEIPTMELKLNNLCNLKCRMCHPMDSTSWNDWSEVKEFYKKENNIMYDIVEEHGLERKPFLDKFQDNPEWWASLEKLLPHFRRVEFAGGEPLMDPTHYRILDMLAPYGDQIEIKYATNLTTLGITKGRTIYDYWPKFKSVAVNVSIDGVGDSYEYIRGNANWCELIDNIKRIQTIPNISRIVGAVTVQVSNVLVLDKIIEYFLNELGIVFHTHRVEYPRVLSAQVLPAKLRALAIQRLQDISYQVKDFKLVKQYPQLLEYTLGQIQDNINYLQARDQSDKWSDCIEFNRRLDATRDQNFLDVTPEFKPYV
jgi:sulfatase maturation enzyme AslB (radical SAM superfamily)